MYDPKFSQKQMYDQYGRSRNTTPKVDPKPSKSSGFGGMGPDPAERFGGSPTRGIGARPPSTNTFGGGQDNNPNRDESENKSTIRKVYENVVEKLKSFGADEPKDVIVDGKRVYQGPAFRGYDPTTRIGDFGGEYGKKNYFLGMESFPTYPRTDVSPTLPPSTINIFGTNTDNPRLNMFGVNRSYTRPPAAPELPTSPDVPANMDPMTRVLSQAMLPTEVNYTIKDGDTLSEIARDAGATVQELKELNNIEDINVIDAGDTLKIPVKASKLTDTQAALRGGFDRPKDNQGVETAMDLSKLSVTELMNLLRSVNEKLRGEDTTTATVGLGAKRDTGSYDEIESLIGGISQGKIKRDFVVGYLAGHEGIDPHKSVEGGKDTAAYGVKNSLGLKRSDYKSGSEGDKDFAAAVALKHYEKTETKFKTPKVDRFGRSRDNSSVWEELGEEGRYALTDLHFNTGTVGSSAADGNAKDAITNTLNYIGMTTKDKKTKGSLFSLAKRRAENWNKAADNLGLTKIDKIQQIPRAGGGTIMKYLDSEGNVVHEVSTGRKPIKILDQEGNYEILTTTREEEVQ